jgi:hypothetical protein
MMTPPWGIRATACATDYLLTARAWDTKPQTTIGNLSHRRGAARAARALRWTPCSSCPAPRRRGSRHPLAVKRTTALSGSHLDVKIERDGEVIRTASADIDLPNVLLAVFSTVPLERGEFPFAVDQARQGVRADT